MTERVETVAFADHYCVVFRRDGQPDEFLVDEKGRPQKFATASVALRQGRKALAKNQAPSPTAEDRDEFGTRAWRAAKDAELKAERDRVFGVRPTSTIERNGRTVIIERKRRR